MDPNVDANIQSWADQMDLLLKESELLGEEKGLSKHLYPRYTKEEVEQVEEFTFFRTILFIGLSGAGKTSSINFLLNTFLGVKFEDNFRFLLINEKTVSGSQAVSQTQDVSIYYVKPFNGNPALRIIDTPGLGDTRGLQQDYINLDKISESLINLEDKLSLSICFIIKASTNRLTTEQNYFNTKIMQLFQKILVYNFSFLITHYDGSEELPKAIEALQYQGEGNNINLISIYIKTGAILNPWYYIVNNKPLFFKNDQKNSHLIEEYWQQTTDSFQQFIDDRIKIKFISNIEQTKQLAKHQLELKNFIIKIKEHYLISIKTMQLLQECYTQVPGLKNQVQATSNYIVSRLETVEEKQFFSDSRVIFCEDCDKVCSTRLVADISSIFTAKRTKYSHYSVCKYCSCRPETHSKQNYITRQVQKTVNEVSEDLKKKHIESLTAYKGALVMQNMYEGSFLQQMLYLLSLTQGMLAYLGAITKIALAPCICKVEQEYLKDYIQQKKDKEVEEILQQQELIIEICGNKGKYLELKNFLQNSIQSDKKQIVIEKFKHLI